MAARSSAGAGRDGRLQTAAPAAPAAQVAAGGGQPARDPGGHRLRGLHRPDRVRQERGGPRPRHRLPRQVQFPGRGEVKEGDILFEIDPRPYQAELDPSRAQVAVAEANLKSPTPPTPGPARPPPAAGHHQPRGIRTGPGPAGAGPGRREARQGRPRDGQAQHGLHQGHGARSAAAAAALVDPGNLVKADDTILTTIVSLDPMYAYFDVDERTCCVCCASSGRARSRRPTRGTSRSSWGSPTRTGFPHKGKIDFVDNRVDPGTGTLASAGVFANPNRVLSPGLFVRVRCRSASRTGPCSSPRRPSAPTRARSSSTSSTTRTRWYTGRVKVGRLDDGMRVITEGLTPGERVVVSGLQRSPAGRSKVEPKAGRSRQPRNTDTHEEDRREEELKQRPGESGDENGPRFQLLVPYRSPVAFRL